MQPTRQEIRAWLQEILDTREETPTALARRAGVAQSTLTRFLNSPSAPMLGLRSIAKIAHAASVEPVGMPKSAVRVPGLGEGDAHPYTAPPDSDLDRAIRAFTDGKSAIDPWEIDNRALEDVGHLPGDIAIVSLNEPARAGDIVCAQCYRWSEGRAETLFRIYEPPYIVAASRDAELRKPRLVDNDRVVIKGVVVALIRVRKP